MIDDCEIGEGIMTCRHVTEEGAEPIMDEAGGWTVIICRDCLNESKESDYPTTSMFLTCKGCLMKRLKLDLKRRKV